MAWPAMWSLRWKPLKSEGFRDLWGALRFRSGKHLVLRLPGAGLNAGISQEWASYLLSPWQCFMVQSLI